MVGLLIDGVDTGGGVGTGGSETTGVGFGVGFGSLIGCGTGVCIEVSAVEVVTATLVAGGREIVPDEVDNADVVAVAVAVAVAGVDAGFGVVAAVVVAAGVDDDFGVLTACDAGVCAGVIAVEVATVSLVADDLEIVPVCVATVCVSAAGAVAAAAEPLELPSAPHAARPVMRVSKQA
jgi:hypothetical protein